MVQSPSWEANWFAASQEIPHISRNPKVHYRTHKRPPPVSILGQPNPVHINTSHLLKIHPNIIHPSTPRSPHWSPSLRFPQQDHVHPLSPPIRSTFPAYPLLISYIIYSMLFGSSRFLIVLPGISELWIKSIFEPHDILHHMKLQFTIVETFRLKHYTKLLFCFCFLQFRLKSYPVIALGVLMHTTCTVTSVNM